MLDEVALEVEQKKREEGKDGREKEGKIRKNRRKKEEAKSN